MKEENSCPVFEDLPSPPPGKTGWPWTDSDSCEVLKCNGGSAAWPRISIITPTYMQGEYIEETIRSVLLQGYPNLEFIIIDGGSTDGTLDLIRKYEKWITYWSSEPDDGQCDAINKGFGYATGTVGNWLNSDDVLMPGALCKIGAAYRDNPGKIICGDLINFIEGGSGEDEQYVAQRCLTFQNVVCYWKQASVWHQPCTYYPVELYTEINGLKNELNLYMDLDLLARLLKRAEPVYLHEPVVRFRIHPLSKTGRSLYTNWIALKYVSMHFWPQLPEPVERREFAWAFCAGCYYRAKRALFRKQFASCLRLVAAGLNESPVEFIKAFIKHVYDKAKGAGGRV